MAQGEVSPQLIKVISNLKKELSELEDKIEKLKNKQDKNEVSFIQETYLNSQLHYMEGYAVMLRVRIIDLEGEL